MIRFPFVNPRGGRSEDGAGTEGAERPLGVDDDALDEAAPVERIRLDEPGLADAARAPDADHEPGPEGDLGAAESGVTLEAADAEEIGLDAEFGAAADESDRPAMEEQIRMVEAMLFASDRPLSTAELASRMPIGCDAAVAVRRLEQLYERRGVCLARVAGKWAFRTAPDLAHLLTGEAVEQRKLSRAAIETLAIVAYHQPVTRAEIEEIRQVGVSKGTLDLLMELEWIKLGRRRQTPGRPVTFVTTDRFLEHFGLETLKDLPRLEELRQAGLLDAAPPKGFAPKLGSSEEDEEPDEDDEALDEEERRSGQQNDFLL